MNALTNASSQTYNDVLQLVTFTLGDEEYAIDILKVQEINRMKEITRIPNSPDYVDGVINLRGKVIPVINLRKRFGLPVVEENQQSRIVIMEIFSIIIGIIVDSVSEVLRISSSFVKPTPPLSTNVSSEFIKGIVDIDNRLIILLDMDKLFDESEKQALVKVT